MSNLIGGVIKIIIVSEKEEGVTPTLLCTVENKDDVKNNETRIISLMRATKSLLKNSRYIVRMEVDVVKAHNILLIDDGKLERYYFNYIPNVRTKNS